MKWFYCEMDNLEAPPDKTSTDDDHSTSEDRKTHEVLNFAKLKHLTERVELIEVEPRIPVDFTITIRHMQYRKFVRWYYGPKEKKRSKLLVFAVCAATLAFNIASTATICGVSLISYNVKVGNPVVPLHGFGLYEIGGWMLLFYFAGLLVWAVTVFSLKKHPVMLKVLYRSNFVYITYDATLCCLAFFKNTESLAENKVCGPGPLGLVMHISTILHLSMAIASMIVIFIWKKVIKNLAETRFLNRSIKDFMIMAKSVNITAPYIDTKTENPQSSAQFSVVPGVLIILKGKFRTRKKTYYIIYVGQVNDNGLPHGFGLWVEYQTLGERLIGYWRHGVPVGPFNSKILGTGNTSSNVVIGLAMYRQSVHTSLLNRLVSASGAIDSAGAPSGCSYAVANAEACVIGDWYRHFPLLNITACGDGSSGFAEMTRYTNISKAPTANEDMYRCDVHLDDGQLRVANSGWVAEDAGVTIKAYKASPVADDPPVKVHNPMGLFQASKKRSLRLDMDLPWQLKDAILKPLGKSKVEMVTTPLEEEDLDPLLIPSSVKHYSLLLDFHKGEFVTSENTRREVLIYINGYNNNAYEAAQMAAQLAALINLPIRFKIICFHWPAGSSFFDFYEAKDAAESDYTQSAFADFLQHVKNLGTTHVHFLTHSMGARIFLSSLRYMKKKMDPASFYDTMQLETVTLINPEYDMSRFIETDFDDLRRIAKLITVYGDMRDRALRWCERFSKVKLMGLHLYDFWTPASDTGECRKCIYDPQNYPFIQVDGELQTIDIDIEHAIITGRECPESKEWLDLDVIDGTHIGQNVHSNRHTYFNLNREISDDLRNIICSRTRAIHRPNLHCRLGNVYNVAVAPAYVVDLWE